MAFADLEEREEALRHGKVYDIHGSPPYDDELLLTQELPRGNVLDRLFGRVVDWFLG